jgi:hypothetical protein
LFDGPDQAIDGDFVQISRNDTVDNSGDIFGVSVLVESTDIKSQLPK